MTNETSKASARRLSDALFTEKVFSGRGIDIGCGEDVLNKNKEFPLITEVVPFDMIYDNRNAELLDNYYVHNSFDFVHSSQCLEHMVDPEHALKSWFNVLKPNGYMVITIPDEDLYEQGIFPSTFNSDHKWTFSIFKYVSWSNKHINLVDLVKVLGQNCDVIRMSLIDTRYNYSLLSVGRVDQTFPENGAEAFIEIVIRKRGWKWT